MVLAQGLGDGVGFARHLRFSYDLARAIHHADARVLDPIRLVPQNGLCCASPSDAWGPYNGDLVSPSA
jgi:hypothetical protein